MAPKCVLSLCLGLVAGCASSPQVPRVSAPGLADRQWTAAAVSAAAVPRQDDEARQAWLRGLRALDVRVSQLDDDADECNVRGDDLEASAERALVDAGIRVVREAHPFLRVAVVVLPLAGGACVASFSLSVHVDVDGGVLRHQAEPGPFPVVATLWKEGGVVSGWASDFGPLLNQSVGRLAARFASLAARAND